MTPNEAVLFRVQTAEHLRRRLDHTNPHQRSVVRDPLVEQGAFLMQAMMVHGIAARAPLYLWRPDLAVASLEAAESLPVPVTINETLLPTLSGFYVFEQPVQVEWRRDRVRGCGWYVDDERLGVMLATLFTAHGELMQPDCSGTVRLNIDVDDWNVGAPNTAWLETGPSGDEPQDTAQRLKHFLRFLVSSWLWVSQKIIVPTDTPASSRVREQAARSEVDPGLRVIQLRRRERSTTGSEGIHEYSCQWLVSGHWRQQFYPSTKEHRPLWIEPT